MESKDDLDILEFLARDMDRNEGKTVDSIKPSQRSDAIPPDWEETICVLCSNMSACPRGLNSTEMESVFECEYFKTLSTTGQPIETKESDQNKNSRLSSSYGSEWHDISAPISESTTSSSDESKQDLINEILARWGEEQGQLKLYCKKCEAEMDKIITTKKIFYRCSNYPECKIEGDDWYVWPAVENHIATNRKKADLIVMYIYDSEKNIVWVSEIYSEGKIFK